MPLAGAHSAAPSSFLPLKKKICYHNDFICVCEFYVGDGVSTHSTKNVWKLKELVEAGSLLRCGSSDRQDWLPTHLAGPIFISFFFFKKYRMLHVALWPCQSSRYHTSFNQSTAEASLRFIISFHFDKILLQSPG